MASMARALWGTHEGVRRAIRGSFFGLRSWLVVTPFALFIGVVLPAVLAGWIGASKGHGLVGVLLGALLSYLGVIIVMFLKPAARDAEASGSPGWWPDPHRRHEYRYFDGRSWTRHVSDNGAASVEA